MGIPPIDKPQSQPTPQPSPRPLRLISLAHDKFGLKRETPQNSWDIAAGALLIQEAGGEMTDILGSPYCLSTRAIIGSNKLVHESIREVLVQAEATRPDSTPQL